MSNTISRDLIADTLASPIEWNKLESICYDILLQDDLPSLRKLGGVGDGGADAIEESFYENERNTSCVVQVTSQATQLAKYKKTVQTLSKNKIEYKKLVLVFKQPISTGTRNEIIEAASDDGITVDIRDQSYLIAHLGNRDNGIYLRHFGSSRDQINHFLNEDDPLSEADDKLKKSVLASIGAFILKPNQEKLESDLFDQMTLAIIGVTEGPSTLDNITNIFDEITKDSSITDNLVSDSVNRLIHDGLVTREGELYSTSDESMDNINRSVQAMKAAASSLLENVVAKTRKEHKLNDAQEGYLERNVKKCMLNLLRKVGPSADMSTELADEMDSSSDGVLSMLSKDLNSDIAGSAAIYLNEYLQDSKQERSIAILARSYAALIMRNTDPLCRKFQREAISRSKILLDTDTVLSLYIDELPQCAILRKAVKQLISLGVEICVPQDVIGECIGHLSRAQKTYNRFAGTLLRRPPEDVLNSVWHAVVQGYYFYKRGGGEHDFQEYWSAYYDDDNSYKYFIYRLDQLFKYTIVTPGVSPDEQTLYDSLFQKTLEYIEKKKKKAEYREDDWQKKRVDVDLRSALYASQSDEDLPNHDSIAYLSSGDRVFAFIENQLEWNQRPNVWIHGDSLPRLAEIVGGTLFNDNQLIQTLFHPVHAAAASSLSDEIDTLTRVGVELQSKPLAKLSWDLSQGLREQIQMHDTAINDDDLESSITVGQHLAEASKMFDYHIDPEITEIYTEFNRMSAHLEAAQKESEEKDAIVKAILEGASGLSKKGRRRVNRILKDFQLQEFYEDDDSDEE